MHIRDVEITVTAENSVRFRVVPSHIILVQITTTKLSTKRKEFVWRAAAASSHVDEMSIRGEQ